MNITALRIRDARIKKGYTLDDLSKKTKIGRASLQRYETDSSEPTINKLKIIAESLDVTPSYLMGWESDSLTTSDYTFINSIFQKLGYTLEYEPEYNDYFFIYENAQIGYSISPKEINAITSDILNYTDFKLLAIQRKLDKKREERNKSSNTPKQL